MRLDPKKAATAYPALELRIVEILVAHDVSGLFALGAPHDEHAREVHTIISKLQSASGVADVESTLEDVLGGWIAQSGKPVANLCASMAPDIWDAWCEFTNLAGIQRH